MKQGEALKRALRDNHIKQSDFADMLGVSRVYLIQLFEKSEIPSKYMSKVKELLGNRIDFANANKSDSNVNTNVNTITSSGGQSNDMELCKKDKVSKHRNNLLKKHK